MWEGGADVCWWTVVDGFTSKGELDVWVVRAGT